MADTNLNILVRVEGARQASTEISSISASTAQVGKQTDEASRKTRQLRSTLGTLATGFAVYKGAQWIKGAVTETIELAKGTAALTRLTGMDAHTAGGWISLAKERGIQSKQLNMGFISLAKQSEKLSEGNKKTAEAFAKMGISAKQWQGLNVQQRMEAVANAFQKMRNPSERAALAQQLFGRSSQALLPLLVKGKAALHAQIEEQAKAAGESGKSLKEQMKLVAEQREMNRAMLQLKVAVATALMPIMVSFAKILAPITAGFAKLMQGSGAFRTAVVALTAALIVYIATLKLAKLAEIETLAVMAPWIALAVGIGVALVMLYQKCAWFRAAVRVVMHAVTEAFVWVKDAAVAVFNWIKSHWVLLASLIGGPFIAALIQVIKHWSTIKGFFEKLAKGIVSIFQGIGAGIADTVKAALNLLAEPLNFQLHMLHALYKKIPDPAGVLPAWPLPDPAIPKLATGGWMSRSGAALVGEQGPEMVHLPQGARVSPFVQGYGGAGPGVIQVPVYLDGRQIALAMGSYTADQKARR